MLLGRNSLAKTSICKCMFSFQIFGVVVLFFITDHVVYSYACPLCNSLIVKNVHCVSDLL